MIPPGWTELALGDVCMVTMGQAPPGESYNTTGAGLPLVAGAGDFGTLHPVAKKFTSAASKKSAPGDIILGIRATIGVKVIADGEYCLGRGVAGLRPAAPLHDRFLWHWLTDARDSLASRGRGATFLQVNRKDITGLPMWLPPIEEQRRIAAVLDQADELRAKRRAALALLDTLTESIFLDMFGDPVSNPMRWPETETLGEISAITSGITKGRRLTGQATRSVPYLAVANVQDRSLRLDVLKQIEATPDEIERFRLQPGDLLLTEGGDPDKLGRGTVWGSEIAECIHQNHIFRVRLIGEAWEPSFVSWLLSSERGKRFFLRRAKQTTGIASINKTQLSEFPLLGPPVDLQNEFRSCTESIALERGRVVQAGAQLDALFASLQQRAFRGEL